MKMPASGGDPVSTTLRLAFSSGSKNGDLDCGLEASAKRALLTRIEYEPATNYQLSVLNSLKSKYIVVYTKPATNNNKSVNGTNVNNKKSSNITLPVPKLTLFPPERVQLGYRGNLSVGSGMSNMGNTCYLNSTLQALFHVPALVNWLMSETAHQNCVQNSDYQMHPDDITCSVIKTFKCSQQKTGNCMKPISVYSKLKAICKHLSHGSQEDAHEFMRYLLESLEKNYLTRFQGHKLDSTSKETTPINQIFGGYIRTEVVCLSCRAVSTTFQHFQDLPLDIRKASTLNDALAGYFERERLPDGEDAYKCEKCNRKVSVTKKFTIEKPPNVLCIQLKRFSMTNGKITKQVQLSQYLDITRFISPNIQPRHPVKYKLVSMVTHMGQSVNCGHYTAIALAANGSYYQFDDSSVRQIPLSTVLSMSAYLILYEMERPFQTVNPRPFPAPSTAVWNENTNGGDDEETWSQSESTINSSSLNSSLNSSECKREGADSQSRMVYQLNKHGKVYAAPPACPTRESPSSNTHQHHNNQPQQQSKKASKSISVDVNAKRSSLVPYESDVSTDSDVENKDRSELEKLLTKLSSSSSATPSSGGPASSSSSLSSTSSSTSPSPPVAAVVKGWKVTELNEGVANTAKSSATPGWDVTEVKVMSKKVVRNLSDTELNWKQKKKQPRTTGSDSELDKFVPSTESLSKDEMKKKRITILEKYKSNFGSAAKVNGPNHMKQEETKESKQNAKREVEKTVSEDPYPGVEAKEDKVGLPKPSPFKDPHRSVLVHGSQNGFSNGRYDKSERKAPDEGHHSHEKSSDKYENGDSPRKDASDLSVCEMLERDLQKKRNVVNNLIQSSHWGYGNSNVKTWNGMQSALEREVNEEKCEGTKRSYSDLYNDDFDRGKIKKLKSHGDRNRPRYNLFQKKQQKYQDKMSYYHWRGNNRSNNNGGRYNNDFRNPFKRQPFNDQFNGNNNWNYSKKNYKFFKVPRSGRKGLITKYFPISGKIPGPKKNQSSG